MDILDRIKKHVTVDPRTGCWVWTGAFKNAKPNLYVYDTRQFSLPPRPWMRDGKSFNHPIRILKRPPKGRRLIRICDKPDPELPAETILGSPYCCNPEHWTYFGEVRELPEPNERLERIRGYYFDGSMTLDEIRDNYGDEIADTLKSEDF